MTIRMNSARRITNIVVCIALAACSKDAPSPATDGTGPLVASDTSARAREVVLTAAQATRIRVAPVDVKSYRSSIATTGTVAFNGDRSSGVLAPVSGPITKILVNPGSVVHRGEALATVTSPDFATASAAYRKAQSAYRNLQRIADLDDQLFKNDAIPRRELEQAQTDAAAALADRDAAGEQMRALGVDAASIAAVRDNRPVSALGAVIRAPIDGTVVEKLCNLGQLIQAGSTQCFTISDLSTVWVMANVFESDLAAVAAGQEATITTEAQPTPIIGRVSYVGSLVDPSSKATAVRVVAPNPRDLLKRDMLVNVSIKATQSRNGILIPASAVLRDDQNLPFVYVAAPNNHFARRAITIGARVGDSYEVKAGVAAGDRIVVDGSLFLQFAGNQ
ncbi:MAG: efflux RND transporter periplasmic adaptor subunit [Gemmatimonadota bacterium]|nr:efflux RND transporter periplasmic adaptor subunit [Gemmatimonadota bacterium]